MAPAAAPGVIRDGTALKSKRPQRVGLPLAWKALLRRLHRPAASAMQRCLDGCRLLLGGRKALRLSLTARRCKGSVPSEALCEHGDGFWHGFCPCCKRPVEVGVADAPARASEEELLPDGAKKKNAYVVVLWGTSPAYCLGAMVLAKSLRMQGTPNELACVHTDDVPPAARDLLARSGWTLHEVPFVEGVGQLYNHGEPRFHGVFTKLRAMGLEQYRRVLLLDIDTLVLRSIDDLFDLPAPAAMARGPGSGYKHGERIDGRGFFRGATGCYGSWGQAWGINAGVMLWKPDAAVMEQMLLEVLDPKHPSHIKGNGPEQDYLSRYWANSWSHIGVEYNFQLHQMYFSLHPDYLMEPCFWDRNRFMFEQPAGDGIRLVHYSGSLKPWTRWLDPYWASVSMEEFCRSVLESFQGYWLWARLDPELWRKREPMHNLVLGGDGKIHRLDWGKWRRSADGMDVKEERLGWADADLGDTEEDGGQEPKSAAGLSNGHGCRPAASSPEERQQQQQNQQQNGSEEWPLGEVVEVPPRAVNGAQAIVDRSMALWDEVYEALQKELGFDSLAEALKAAYAPPAEAGCKAPDEEMPAVNGQRPESSKVGWKSCSGWWVNLPGTEPASALAATVPEPRVVLSVGTRVVVDERGAAALGAMHAAALLADGSIVRPPPATAAAVADGLPAWLAGLPAGALVLLALADLPGEALAAACGALAAACPGSVEAVPPPQCRVAAFVGRKGSQDCETMAALDCALATMPASSGRGGGGAAEHSAPCGGGSPSAGGGGGGPSPPSP